MTFYKVVPESFERRFGGLGGILTRGHPMIGPPQLVHTCMTSLANRRGRPGASGMHIYIKKNEIEGPTHTNPNGRRKSVCILCKKGWQDEDRLRGEYAGTMESRRQQGEAADEGSEEVAAASCFLGSEFQVGSRADVARGDATAEDGDNGGSIGSERQVLRLACVLVPTQPIGRAPGYAEIFAGGPKASRPFVPSANATAGAGSERSADAAD